MLLYCQPSEAMPAGGIIAKIGGGGSRDLYDRARGDTRADGMPDRAQGAPRRRGGGGLFRMGVLARGGVPSTVRSDGAQNFASAHNPE